VTALSDALRSFAEEPAPVISEPPLPSRRVVKPGFTIEMAPVPTQSVTSCIRSSLADLDATIADVRATARAAGFTRNVWQVGPSCSPAGLADLLKARGFAPVARPPYEASLTVMVLTSPPPPPTTPGIEARLCTNLDEYVQALRVAMSAFNESEEDAAGWIAAAPAFWADQDGVWRFTHIAYLDGRPVGMGFGCSSPSGVLLGGSGVLEAARGRGVYRALLQARWEQAERIGRPGLVVQAGAMSRPILERCGFKALCELQLLDDLGFMSG
jgi:GNAT superfamily N-acetyltransferase